MYSAKLITENRLVLIADSFFLLKYTPAGAAPSENSEKPPGKNF